MSADVSVEQKPQGGSGFAAPWNPQFSPNVDTPLPPAFSPPSAPYGPPIPLSQPPSQSPDNQEPGTRWRHLHLFVSAELYLFMLFIIAVIYVVF